MTRALLQGGADPSLRATSGLLPLDFGGDTEAMLLLIDAGAPSEPTRPPHPGQWMSPLPSAVADAVSRNRSSVAEALIRRGDADGHLDAANVATIAQGGRAKVAAAPSGRFLLTWYTLMASPGGDTCSILGQLFSPDAQPEGNSFVIYDAPAGRCAARFDVATCPVRTLHARPATTRTASTVAP